MSDDPKLHDLLLFGTDLEDAKRTEAIQKLANLLKISSEQVEGLLQKKSVVLLKRVSTNVAHKYERKLIELGFKCNTRPSKETAPNLELVPKEALVHTLSCPDCGHVHKYKEGEDAPETCDSCGIVFSKYSQNLKLEKEKIKRALLAKAERDEKQQQQEKQRLQEEDRRRLLEEEIRRELGLPRFVSKRSTLITSATGLFALGLALGVGGVLAYGSLTETQDISFGSSQEVVADGLQNASPAGMQQIPPGPVTGIENGQVQKGPVSTDDQRVLPNLPPETVSNMEPEMVAHLQVTGMLDSQPSLSEVPSSSAAAEGGEPGPEVVLKDATAVQIPSNDISGNTSVRSLVSQVTSADIEAVSAAQNGSNKTNPLEDPAALEHVRAMHANLTIDPEWDDFVLRQTHDMIAKSRISAALRTIKLMRDRARLTEERASLAVWLASNGETAESDRLFRQLVTEVEGSSVDNRTKVVDYHTVARYQAKVPGKSLDAEATAMKARHIAESEMGSCDQAVVSAEVAGMMGHLGHHKAAREAYQRSNEGLGSIEGKQRLLFCLGDLVETYIGADNRSGATILLQDLIKGGKGLTSQADRDAILQRASLLSRKLGDMQTAQTLAGEIRDSLMREETRYRNVINEARAGRIGTAMQGMEAIESPFYHARASALLGLSQGQHETYSQLAGDSFKQAGALITSFSNPMEKIVVSAELARYAAHAGRDAEADAGFTDAAAWLDLVPDANNRSRPTAILAANQARALRLADARRQLMAIEDVDIAQIPSEILSDSETLVREKSQ